MSSLVCVFFGPKTSCTQRISTNFSFGSRARYDEWCHVPIHLERFYHKCSHRLELLLDFFLFRLVSTVKVKTVQRCNIAELFWVLFCFLLGFNEWLRPPQPHHDPYLYVYMQGVTCSQSWSGILKMRTGSQHVEACRSITCRYSPTAIINIIICIPIPHDHAPPQHHDCESFIII